MKKITVTRCAFPEVFAYAEKHFGITWNPCNDLFFKTRVLAYDSLEDIFLEDMYGSIGAPEGVDEAEWFKTLTKDTIDQMSDKHKARVIMAHFMLANNLQHVEVDGR